MSPKVITFLMVGSLLFWGALIYLAGPLVALVVLMLSAIASLIVAATAWRAPA